MRADGVIVPAAVASLSVAMMAPAEASAPAFVGLLGLLAWALARKLPPAVHVTLLCALWAGTSALFPASRKWPYKILIPLAVYAAIVASTPWLGRSMPWLRKGRMLWGGIVAVSVISGAALALWVDLAKPDLSIHLANIPDIPPWTYPLAAVIFAAGNAAVEEFVFRGVVLDSLDRTLGANAWAMTLHALCFGAMHFYQGFPNGWLGMAMATVYGGMLGEICRRSGGLLAPWTAHVAADLTIFALVAANA